MIAVLMKYAATGNAAVLAIQTRVRMKKSLDVAQMVAMVTTVLVPLPVVRPDTFAMQPSAKCPQRKNARRTTIVRRTKNAPTVIASIANKQTTLQKKRPFGRFFLHPFSSPHILPRHCEAASATKQSTDSAFAAGILQMNPPRRALPFPVMTKKKQAPWGQCLL